MESSALTINQLISQLRECQVLRFVIIGIVNTSFSYGIYAGLLFVGIGYALANLMALVIGILFSFKTQGHLVFGNPDNRLLGRFVLTWIFVYFFTITLIGRIIALGFDAYSAGALAFPFSAALSYLIQKYFVFRQSNATTRG